MLFETPLCPKGGSLVRAKPFDVEQQMTFTKGPSCLCATTQVTFVLPYSTPEMVGHPCIRPGEIRIGDDVTHVRTRCKWDVLNGVGGHVLGSGGGVSVI